MADTPVDVITPDTDDLTAFETLLHGPATAEPEEVVEETEEVVELADDSSATEEEDAEDVDPTEPTGEEETTEPEEVEAEEEPEEDILKPKKKPSAKERIDELTAARRAAEREAEALRQRVAELEAAKNKEDKPEPKAQVVSALDADAPDPDAVNDDGELLYPLGEFDPKYIADLTRYTIRKETEEARKTAEAEAEAAKQKAEDDALKAAWEDKLAKSEEGIEDLRETLVTLDDAFSSLDPEYGTYLARTIMGMDAGPEVLYYLANNLDEARQIVAAGPLKATFALGKIEARIESALKKKATPPKVTTKAPTPPPTATRGNSSRLTVRPDTDDLDAFEKLLFKKK